MAPKVEDNLKNRKKPEEPGKTAKTAPEKGKDKWEIMKQKLANPITQKIVYSSVLLLVLAAMVLIVLYFVKLKTITEKYRAATKIYKFMQNYNDSFRGQKVIQTFKGVEEVLEELQEMHARNRDLQASIDIVLRLLKEDWVPFGGYLYKFYNRERTFEEAKNFCERNNTFLPEIHSDEEQNFMIQEVFRNQYATWLGILKLNEQWQWLSGGTPKKFYWSDGKPSHNHQPGPICMDVHVCHKRHRPKCWNDIECWLKRRTICRMKPDPRWL